MNRDMGTEKIRFVYVEFDNCLVAKGEGDLEGIVVQADTVDKLKEKIKQAFCGYIEIPSSVAPDILRKVTKAEWNNSVHVTHLLVATAKVWDEEQTAIKEAKSNPQTINYLVGKIIQHTKGHCKPKLALEICKVMIDSE